MPLHKISFSVAMKMGLYIVPYVIVVFVVSLGFLFSWSREMVRQEAIERADCELKNTAQRITGLMNEIQTVTNNTVWQIEENMNPDSLLALSHVVVTLNPDINGCSITMEPDALSGVDCCFSAYSLRVGDSVLTVRENQYDYYDKVWYKNAHDTKQPIWIDPFDDYNEGSLSSPVMITSYCVPLIDKEERVMGVISTDLSLLSLSQAISKNSPYENSYCMMLGSEGHYYVHPDSTRIISQSIFDDLDPLNQADIIALGHEMVAGNHGMMKVRIDDVDCLVFYQSVENTSWSVALVCPESDMFSSYNNLLYVLVPLMAIGLLFLLIFLRSIVNYFVKPLNKLASQTRHIADGHFDEPMPTTKRIDAIGRLQNNFSAMQRSLSEYINHLEQVNAETEQRNAELVNANQQAEEASQRQVAFLQDILHQIRTPLNIIMGFVQILRDDYAVIPREEMVTITHTLKHNANAITRRVHMLMAASSIDVGRTVERNDYVTCMALLKEVEQINIDRAPEGAPLQIESLVDDGLIVRVNREFVVKVLNELVHNAQKYALAPGHEKEAIVILRVRQDDSKLIFSVEDNGPGVPADYRANIFNPFIKANSFSEGLGLGLFVVKRFANMMGGDLMLDDTYTLGARFVFEIPYK